MHVASQVADTVVAMEGEAPEDVEVADAGRQWERVAGCVHPHLMIGVDVLRLGVDGGEAVLLGHPASVAVLVRRRLVAHPHVGVDKPVLELP